MTNLQSSVLLVGEKIPVGNPLALQHIRRLSELEPKLAIHIDVIILPLLVALSDEAKKYLHIFQAQNPALQVVLVSPRGAPVAELQECLNQFPIYFIIDSVQAAELEASVMMALEQAQQLRQNRQLEALIQEQNERLGSLYKELEERVKKRQNFLEEARAKSVTAHERWRLLLKATENVQQAESLGDIEKALNLLLAENLKLVASRIFPRPQDAHFREQQKSAKLHVVFEAALRPREEDVPFGAIFFMRKQNLPFTREETEFLERIAEIVSLAIDRLYQFEQNLALKEHWQATFNAVSDPVIMINSQYEVVQSNGAFERIWLKAGDLKKKCYEILFQRNSPCPQCQLGRNFRLDYNLRTATLNYDIYGQALTEPTTQENLYVHQYHDVTRQQQMERKIMEAARMAEIGMIGSSIAHELNNPLAGMLSFAQLIKASMKETHPLRADVIELELGIKRCRDIVQNLLGFSRSSAQEVKAFINLAEITDRAVKILELQSKGLGVEIKITKPALPAMVEGYAGYLTQALQNILQHSLQNILEKSKSQKNFRGLIEVQITRGPTELSISVLDNGLAEGQADNWSSLGLSIAQQIVHDHGGRVEFFEDSKPFHFAKITLPETRTP